MRIHSQLGRRYRQIRDLLVTEGAAGLRDRVRRAAAEALALKTEVMPVDPDDVVAADLSKPLRPFIPKLQPGAPMIINWVTIPAGPRSGGHTTMYRMINYLEARGHKNRVYFYNVYRGDNQYYESIAREFYGFRGEIGTIDKGMQDANAVIATSWPTAYPVYNSSCAGKRFYFVQDFEPSFYAVGAMSCLADNTYRMGYHAITAGGWLAQKLSAEYGMHADYFDFGSDTSHYHLKRSDRSGIVFYARPDTPRRGFELGLMAIKAFAARRPEIDIHLYGEKVGRLPFRFIDHGRVTADELNEIYNSCYAGLSLSLTNVSLVPHEMLAAGCIPVVNDAPHNKMVLNNPFVRYAAADPIALATELESVITPDFASLSQAAAASVHAMSWEHAGAKVECVLQKALSTNSEAADPELVTAHLDIQRY